MISLTTKEPMSACNHEEADTRICVHVGDALRKGDKHILIQTVDTDVVIILIGLFHNLQQTYEGIHLYVAFGAGKNYKEFSINHICDSLGVDKCVALPAFHAFTGCDTTSQFYGKGKKSAWEAWNAFPTVTMAFKEIATKRFQKIDSSSEVFHLLETFVCILYDRTASMDSVNELRQALFARKSVSMENIPPTKVPIYDRFYNFKQFRIFY